MQSNKALSLIRRKIDKDNNDVYEIGLHGNSEADILAYYKEALKELAGKNMITSFVYDALEKNTLIITLAKQLFFELDVSASDDKILLINAQQNITSSVMGINGVKIKRILKLITEENLTFQDLIEILIGMRELGEECYKKNMENCPKVVFSSSVKKYLPQNLPLVYRKNLKDCARPAWRDGIDGTTDELPLTKTEAVHDFNNIDNKQDFQKYSPIVQEEVIYNGRIADDNNRQDIIELHHNNIPNAANKLTRTQIVINFILDSLQNMKKFFTSLFSKKSSIDLQK